MVENPTEEWGPGDVEWDRIDTITKEEKSRLHNQSPRSERDEATEEQKVGLYAGFWYLLDDNDSPVSDGYHKITIPRESFRMDGVYKGWIGQDDYRINARADKF